MPAEFKRVLDVGQCRPDHAAIRSMLVSACDAIVDEAPTIDAAIEAARRTPYDLVLVNRLLDRDGSQGLDLIERLKDDEQLKHVPVMLVSNLPDAQAAAVEAGALPGFGKSALRDPRTLARVRAVLGDDRSQAG